MKVAHVVARNVIPEGMKLPVAIIASEEGKLYMSHIYVNVKKGMEFKEGSINCLNVRTFTLV